VTEVMATTSNECPVSFSPRDCAASTVEATSGQKRRRRGPGEANDEGMREAAGGGTSSLLAVSSLAEPTLLPSALVLLSEGTEMPLLLWLLRLLRLGLELPASLGRCRVSRPACPWW